VRRGKEEGGGTVGGKASAGRRGRRWSMRWEQFWKTPQNAPCPICEETGKVVELHRDYAANTEQVTLRCRYCKHNFEEVRQDNLAPPMEHPNGVRERLAAYAHDAWAGWMNYLFSKCKTNNDGTVTIPEWAVMRWHRQATTPYHELPEREKESDRLEAEKILGQALRPCDHSEATATDKVCPKCLHYIG
jgi:hypothetical protein